MPIHKDNNTILNQVEGSSIFRDANRVVDKKKKKLESTIVMKINDDHKRILEDHFKNEKGLALSSGIRQIIFDYMRSNNLI